MKKYLYAIISNKRKDLFAKVLQGFLFVLSIVYRGVVTLILWMYKQRILKKRHLAKQAISVGNITLGGVGKTPFVEAVARILKDHQVRSAVLMRGYMAKGKSFDEADMLNGSLKDVPIAVGRDRYVSSQSIKGNDVFILDDGFQQWGLERNLDIVLIDSTNPFGNGCLIPRGILREPLSSLARADVIALTRMDHGKKNVNDIIEKITVASPKAIVIETIHKPVHFVNLANPGEKRELSSIDQKTVCVFSGIGNPKSFEQDIVRLGANVQKAFRFMDHYRYCKQDIERISHYCQANKISTLIITQKDAVKMRDYIGLFPRSIDVLVLEICIEILKGKDAFKERILNISHS